MKKYLATTVAIAMTMLAGCAWIAENESSARLLTTYATLKVIDGDSERADRVEAIALEVLQLAADEPQATISRLVSHARTLVPWDRLDQADTLLVNGLLIELEVRLIERYGEGIMPDEARLTVADLAGWVIAAAQTVPDT